MFSLNEIMYFFYTLVSSSLFLPPIVEFVSHKVTGWKKIFLMSVISLIVSFLTLWKAEAFVNVDWKDIASVLAFAGLLLQTMASSWKAIWKDRINPLLDGQK